MQHSASLLFTLVFVLAVALAVLLGAALVLTDLQPDYAEPKGAPGGAVCMLFDEDAGKCLMWARGPE